MSELTVNSWHRKGRHLLYVSRASDRTSIGYWDLAANEAHPNHPGDLYPLVRAVRRWTQEHPTEAAWWIKPGEEPGADLVTGRASTAVSTPAPTREQRSSALRAFWARVRGTKQPEQNWIRAEG